MTATRTLSPFEAVFLHIESVRTPMHMASLALFEGGPLTDEHGNLRMDDIRQLISSRFELARIGLRVPAWFGWRARHPLRRATSMQRTAMSFASWLRGGIIAPSSPL